LLARRFLKEPGSLSAGILEKSRYGTKSNVWQLGAIIYSLLLSSSTLDVNQHNSNDRYSELEERGYSYELRKLVVDCMELDQEDRPNALDLYRRTIEGIKPSPQPDTVGSAHVSQEPRPTQVPPLFDDDRLYYFCEGRVDPGGGSDSDSDDELLTPPIGFTGSPVATTTDETIKSPFDEAEAESAPGHRTNITEGDIDDLLAEGRFNNREFDKVSALSCTDLILEYMAYNWRNSAILLRTNLKRLRRKDMLK
jgi:serine/threonine protein kinase